MDLGKSFIEYTSWKSMFAKLPANQSQSLHISIFDYVESGKEPDFSSFGEASDVLSAVFDMMRGAIDANKAKYQEISQKRSESGKKGAKARWKEDKKGSIAKDSKTGQMPTKDSKSCLNVNNNDNENDFDNVNDNNNANILNWIESILSVYPKRGNEESAKRQIAERIKEGEAPEKILNAARVYAKECKVNDKTEQFIKAPNNFFCADGRYLDYMDKSAEDIKPPKKKERAKTPFQEVKGRDYDYEALERQLLAVNEEQ